jgi:hypothetical protein
MSAPAPARRRTPARTAPLLVRLVVRTPRRPVLILAVAVLALGGSIFGAVSLNALAASGSMHASALLEDRRAAEVAYGSLLAQVATMESPGRIQEAAGRLGLAGVAHPRQLPVMRLLPADGAAMDAGVADGGPSDNLKPLLSMD